MLKFISVIFCIYIASLLGEGEAINCYHCFDSFNSTLDVRSFEDSNFGSKLVRCDKNMNKWNTWTCPPEWPVCVYVTGKVKNHVEIIRTCAQRDFCTSYKPPPGVKVEYCRECDRDFCNDFAEAPEPPAKPDALFTFNININLKLNKNPIISHEDPK